MPATTIAHLARAARVRLYRGALRRRADQMGCPKEKAIVASRTPVITNGDRAARSSEFAYDRAATPVASISGVMLAAANTVVRERLLIHALARAPAKDMKIAEAGMRTSPSDAASSEFFTAKAPGSLMPLAANASCNCNSTCASTARLKENAKHSKISVATSAHHKPAMTASMNDRVRSHAAEAAAPNSASINKTGLMMRAKCLFETNDSMRWFATCTVPSTSPASVPALSAMLTSARRWYQTQIPAMPYASRSPMSVRSRPLPAPIMLAGWRATPTAMRDSTSATPRTTAPPAEWGLSTWFASLVTEPTPQRQFPGPDTLRATRVGAKVPALIEPSRKHRIEFWPSTPQRTSLAAMIGTAGHGCDSARR